jgi:nitroreductase
MEFYDVVKNRKSIRAYKDEPIDKDALARIGEAVNLAPSACNIQPWCFRIILNRDVRDSISSCYKNEWMRRAPAIVVAMGNRDAAWKRLDGSSIIGVDIGIAMEHLVLAATAEGLGTCWICAYDVGRMNSVLGILPPWEVLAISPLGRAAENPEPRKRKTLSDVFRIVE